MKRIHDKGGAHGSVDYEHLVIDLQGNVSLLESNAKLHQMSKVKDSTIAVMEEDRDWERITKEFIPPELRQNNKDANEN